MTDHVDKQTEATALDADSVLPRAVALVRHHVGPGRDAPRLSAAARAALIAHNWAGGEAELDDCIQRALVLAHDGLIQADDLGLAEYSRGTVRGRARAAVLRTLRAADGQRSLAAARLGIRPRSLRLLLARLRTEGLNVPGAAAGRRMGGGHE